MRQALIATLLTAVALLAKADDRTDCQAGAGRYLSGTVVQAPSFSRGKPLKGVELSHTHLRLKADQDGQSYDVAIDNVFASGYDQAGEAVPAPLNSIAVGDKLAVCGQPFPGGIHWVHTNCGAKPTPNKPNGWVRKIESDGQVSDNLEGNTEYCRLWGNGKASRKHGQKSS